MLWKVLEANNGLPDCAKVVFANTGKEREETLEFVEKCSTEWKVPIVWLEYFDDPEEAQNRFSVVNFITASREGEPFAAIIKRRNYLPNPVARFCTIELKILTIERFLRSLGWEYWHLMLGIRFDEQRRVAKIRASSSGRAAYEHTLPLADSGVTKHHVAQFWAAQPFNLALPSLNGTTYHGNCDLCFLKGYRQIKSLIAESPERAIWWANQEGVIANAKIANGGFFRKDRPSYAAMLTTSEAQGDLLGYNDDAIDCYCGE
jgi:3'-phosphoadenosine 5'-phosphosulfate sulfotransferase (PAPS reductase)/FAD synthetase